MANMRFGERLQAIRQGRLIRNGPEIGVRELARASGVSATAISEAENGKQWTKKLPSYDDIRALARALGVTIDQLVGDDETPVLPAPIDEETMALAAIGKEVLGVVERRNRSNIRRVELGTLNEIRVPVVNAIAASRTAIHGRQVEETIAVPAILLARAKEPVAFVIVGDCLARRGILTGDYLIVDAANQEPRDGQIVAARINGEECAKVFFRVGDRIELRPDPEPGVEGYEPIIVTARDEMEIIGVYVGMMRVD